MLRPYSLILLIAILVFSGCAQKKPTANKIFENLEDIKPVALEDNSSLYASKYKVLQEESGDKKSSGGKIEKVPVYETHPFASSAKKKKRKSKIYVDSDDIKISVEDVPVNEFLDLVLGKVLKLNYIVDPKVRSLKTPVTLNMQVAQNAKEFYKVFEELLSMQGIAIEEKNGIYFIKKYKGAKKSAESTNFIYGRFISSDIISDKHVVVFAPLYHLASRNIGPIIRGVGVGGVRIYTSLKDTLIIAGSALNVRKALEVLRLLDRPSMSGKIPYLITLENISVEEFEKTLREIFKKSGVEIVQSPSSLGIVMAPVKELNALYVVVPNKNMIKTISYWKDKLDKISNSDDAEPRLYIYRVKNRKADELAKVVQSLIGTSLRNKSATSLKTNEKPKNSEKVEKVPAEVKDGATILSNLNYTPKITADKDTNILMLKLMPSHYNAILPFIKELDSLPLQTLVEVTVAEVTMTDTFSLGFEYAIRNYRSDIVKETININGGGGGLGVIFSGNYIDATINALAKKQLLNIVSRPKMLIMNNNTGTINVGTQVPIITSEVSTADATAAAGTPAINRNITYRTTGVSLGVTPTINSNGILTMTIKISLSEAQLNDTSGIDSPLIVNRDLSTVAVIRSGDTILIGGLISTNKSSERGGVPLLMDIPYIGELFSSKSNKTTKTELIMLIRPIIIESSTQMADYSYRYNRVLKVLKNISL